MRGGWTLVVVALLAIAGCRRPEAEASETTSGTSPGTSTGAPEVPDEPPADCRESEYRGPYPLPDAVVDSQYDVDLLHWEYGVVVAAGVNVEGDIPPGLTATVTTHLTGLPTTAGIFEIAVASHEHWVPPGCPGVAYSTAFAITVLAEASTTTDTSSASTGEDGSSSS